MEFNLNFSKDTKVIIKEEAVKHLASYLKDFINRKFICIIDSLVYELYGNLVKNALGKSVHFIMIDGNEENKNLNTLNYIYSNLIKFSADRDTVIIGMGGGLILDIACFAASTYMRGLTFISVPTTVLASVDASIGGKCGINFEGKKNYIGSFYHPKMIIIDPTIFDSQTDIEITCGLAEALKMGLMFDESLVSDIINNPFDLETIISKSIAIKEKIVKQDEYDLNVRHFLNYGHSFGHIIELKEEIPHGLAILSGILMIQDLAYDLNLTKTNLSFDLMDLFKKLNIEVKHYDYHDYLKYLFEDKKTIAQIITIVYLENLYQPKMYKYQLEK